MSSGPQRQATWHEAYDAQMGLWRWVRSDAGLYYLRRGLEMMEREVPAGTAEMLRKLYAAEERKLLDAEPIFVSAEMCEVVDAAKAGFEPEVLLPTDLMTAHGFLYFEKPFVVKDRFDAPFKLKAISWSPLLGNPRGRRDELDKALDERQTLIDYLAGRDYVQMWDEIEVEGSTVKMIPESANPDGLAITIYQEVPDNQREVWARSKAGKLGRLPKLVGGHYTPWWFGMSFEGNEVDSLGNPTGAEWWWKIAQTTFRLMQQRLSTRSRYTPARAARREAKRYGFPDETEVLVVRLRREKSETSGPPTGEAHYSHRFIVHGFWRNQWYPSAKMHRQIYISDFVKGPEDAPLVVRPRRAYTWSR
jgi:hypothetical protein